MIRPSHFSLEGKLFVTSAQRQRIRSVLPCSPGARSQTQSQRHLGDRARATTRFYVGNGLVYWLLRQGVALRGRLDEVVVPVTLDGGIRHDCLHLGVLTAME